MLGLSSGSEDTEGIEKVDFRHYDASQLLELDVVGRAVWSLPTTADISLTARLNDDDDRDLLFDDDTTCVMRSRARTLPVGNQVPDRKHYQEGVRPAEDFVIKYLREQKKLKLVSLLEQKLSKAAAARVERPDIEEGQHMLENNWTFWFDNYAKPVTNSSCIWEKQSFEQTVTELGSFNSIEGFWSYWNHLRVGSLKDNCNLRMFQKGTRPTCEDPMNRTGGRWVARNLPKLYRDQLWSYVLMAVIGEQLEEEGCVQSVSGVVLSTRESGDNIQLWLDGGYRYRSKMKEMGKPLQPILNNAEASRAIIRKLQGLLFPGDPTEYFTWQPQYHMVSGSGANVDRQRVAHDDSGGYGPRASRSHAAPFHNNHGIGQPSFQQHSMYSYDSSSQPTPNHPVKAQKPRRQSQQPQPPPPPSQLQPQQPSPPQMPTDSPSPATTGEPEQKAKGNADNEEYRLEKQRQIREFLADADANPGKFTKREVRNSKRQLAMLERRQAQLEAERAGLTQPSHPDDAEGDALDEDSFQRLR